MGRIVTLCTDFGGKDGYVGAIKGALLSIAPTATVVDITHAIPPQDVLHAAFVLRTATPFYPRDAIHVVVVDPTVGSERRAVGVETDRGTYVAPDNGVLTLVLESAMPKRAVSLVDAGYWRLGVASKTFHGRDIFAPVAGHLANGVPLEAMGQPVCDLVHLPQVGYRRVGGSQVEGHIVHVDVFGNLISDVPASALTERKARSVWIDDMGPFDIGRTYGDVAPGALLALIGSSGLLEVAVREGSAAERLRTGRGARVRIT